MPIEPVPQSLMDRPVTPPTVDRDVSTAEVVAGFNRQENVVTNLLDMGLDAYFTPEADPNYDPFLDMGGYEGWAQELSNVESREEMIRRKNDIDQRNEDMQNFASADGLQKTLAIGSLIAADPTTLIPIGGAAYKTYRVGGRILEGGLKTAGIAAAVETSREALLQYNQDTRTVDDALVNIGAATVVGGILGGAAAGMSKANIDEIAQRYSDEMITPVEVTSPGLSSVGAAQTGTTIQQEEIKGINRTKKAFKKIPSFLKNPAWETATSNSNTVRQLSEKLSDHSLVKNKNTEGIASEQSVELGIKMYDTLRIPFHKDYQDAWKTYKKRIKSGLLPGESKMTRAEFDEAIGKALRRNDQSDIPEVAIAAQSARRNVFDPVLKRAEEVGMFKNVDEIDVKTADSWLKRVYDVDKIQANRPEFKRRVMSWLQRQREMAEEGTIRAGRDDLELNDIAEQIIDRITNVTQGRIPYDNTSGTGSMFKKEPGARGSAKARVFAIPDSEIEDFLVSDINVVMESHLRTMAPDNELLGKFGTLDFDDIKKQIQEDYNRIRAKAEKDASLDDAAKAKTMQKIERDFNKDLENIQAMWDKLRGLYAQPDDYSALRHIFERGALALNFSRLLGDLVSSSVPDLGKPVMVHGFERSYGDLIKSLVTDFKGVQMAKGEMVEMGMTIDLVNSTTALRRANLDSFAPAQKKADVLMQKTASFVARYNGSDLWNSTMKTMSGIMTQNRMLKAIEDLGAGKKIGQEELENLASHGIGKDMAKRIAAQFAKHGETRRVLRIANARVWDDASAKRLFQAAVRKQVDEIIVTPGLDRPLWLSWPGWRLLGQFKSFGFSSMQRTTMAGLQQGDARVVQGVVMSTLLGSLVYAYKIKMRGDEPSDDPRVWITEGIDRSGITGWFFDVNNIVEKATRGTVGVNALVGGPPMSRYASRNVTGALLGPSFGAAQDIFQITGGAFSGDFSQSDTHAARRLLPGQNIPYLRHLFDKVEEGVNATMGIKE